MRLRRTLAANDTLEIFDQAVRDRCLAIVTVQEGDDWISFKSRFLERDPNRRFIVLDYQSLNGERLPDLSQGRYVGVSFRHRSRKVLFATSVEARGHYVVDSCANIPAVRYRWPETMTELQRRSYYRTPVPESQILMVSLWPRGINGRQEALDGRSVVVTGQLYDISCGGAFVKLNQPLPAEWNENQTLGAELHLGDGKPPVILDVRFRGSRADGGGQPGVAIQFVGLELTVDGRLILERISACVQRFHRLSMAVGSREWAGKLRM